MQTQHQSGIIVIDKPPGISSAKVVAKVKHLLNAEKVGHAGTLDPFAEGVLVCCINRATRLARFLLSGNKTYEATLKLGIETDTQDSTGNVVAARAVADFTEQQIRSAIEKFIGSIEQRPPIFSALKHKGTPLYKLARQGRPVQKPARRVRISEIKILEINLPLVHLEVSCSAGTYIRTLCADIGAQLGCGGHLSALRRTASSGFSLQQAVSLPQLEKQALARGVNGSLISMTDALVNMPQWRPEQKLIEKIRHGQPIRKTDMDPERLAEPLMEDGAHLKVVDASNALLAVLRYEKSRDRLAYACVFQNSTI